MADLRTLSIFVKVGERRSFIGAARELGMTQSGVSNAIIRLEDQLGVRLIARTTRRVNLTEDGMAYFERCRQILGDLGDAELVLTRARTTPTGRLRVDMPVAFGRLKVVPQLGAFQALYPDVQLALTFTDRYIDLVEEGVDVAVRFGRLQDSSLIARRLSETRFHVVGSPDYFARAGRPTSLDELQRHRCLVLAQRETHVRDWRFRDSGEIVQITPPPSMTFSDGSAICTAVCAGYGLAQIHDYYADDAIAAGRLEPVLDKFRAAPDPIWVVYPQTRHLSARVRAFIDFMIARFKQAPAAPLWGDIDHSAVKSAVLTAPPHP